MMKHWKMGLGLLGLVTMIGCGGKKEETAPAATTGSGGAATPPPGIADQIKNNPSIPPEQRAKYGGK